MVRAPAVLGLLFIAGAWAGAAATAAAQAIEGGPESGRVIWLSADRGVERGLSDLVTAWSDAATRAGVVVGTTGNALPEWRAAAVNGRPGLHFDGNDFLYGGGMPTGSYTKAVAFTLDTLAPTNNLVSSAQHHALYYGSSDRARLFHSGDFVTSGQATAVGEPTVLVATYDAATGDGALWQNGTLVATGNDGGVGNWDASLLLGSFAYSFFMEGSLAEVLVYDHVVNAAELAWLHAYLLQRYRTDPAPVVAWSLLPRPGQILQRDDSDQGRVKVKGDLLTAGYDSAIQEIWRDGLLLDTKTKSLAYSGGRATFAFSTALAAGKYDHEVRLFVQAGARRRLIAAVRNVSVGDVWIIHGQSNAAAADYWGEQLANADSQSRWLRSFGTASTGTDVAQDLHWDVADGESYLAHASVGQWGIRLGELLHQRHDLPIALLNGAVGGTSITLHQRNDANPTDLGTIYGRLLYRAVEAGVSDATRAMLWYQGESDSDNATQWLSNWFALRADWSVDYPAMTSIKLFQIRDDCAGGAPKIRETQRSLQDLFPDTYVMSTTAAPAHDGCHYQHLGYRELGDRIARILGRDFYGSTDTHEIDPPNVESAVWNDVGRTQVLLTFRDPDDVLLFDPGAEGDFVLDDGTAVLSGTVAQNTLLLQLAGASTATTIAYWGHPFDGPWLRNARNVGALTFFDVPVR